MCVEKLIDVDIKDGSIDGGQDSNVVLDDPVVVVSQFVEAVSVREERIGCPDFKLFVVTDAATDSICAHGELVVGVVTESVRVQ
jgi:hypothetical protein